MKGYEITTFEDFAREVESCEPPSGATRVVAVDGPSGSGKTTFAARLSSALTAPIVHMDDLFPGWDGLSDSTPRFLEWILQPLARGEVARYRRFDWERSEYAEWNEVPKSDALVVEGVGSGVLAAAPYLTKLVWVEAPKELRMDRGIERDGEAFRPHWERWARQEAAMFARDRTRERADLIVSGSPDMDHDPSREFVLLPG